MNFVESVVPSSLAVRARLVGNNPLTNALTPAGANRSELSFHIVDNGAFRPRQKIRRDPIDALAAPRRRNARDRLRPVMADVAAVLSQTDHDTRGLRAMSEQSRFVDLVGRGEARGAVDTWVAPRAPASAVAEPHEEDGRTHGRDKHHRLDDGEGSLRVVGPRSSNPFYPLPRLVECHAMKMKDGLSQSGRISRTPRHELRRGHAKDRGCTRSREQEPLDWRPWNGYR
ncbi:hypothetical protein UFOVP1244_1 [uncultured Caudovirales phage]|uniref:Uncharacterized protein n=1 Tax=uncultured Caudovirales phage TaxID=2100421 RepID=A0A6J5RK54_9CAUD|nr:hypothetical protein UFOVP1244_1 [uncultured Caudovirales phage]